jgi:alkylated DNA repair dioxygenase AlkB
MVDTDPLATSLKAALGPGPYRSFRATSHALQLGDITPDQWYDTASRALSGTTQRVALLDAVVGSIPDISLRSESMQRAPLTASTRRRRRRRGSWARRAAPAEVLAPGLVCLRRAIDLDTQTWLAEQAFILGEGKEGRQGFYDTIPGDTPGDAPVLRLNQGTRGRVILPTDAFPDKLAQIVHDCVKCAQLADSPTHVPDMNPTTALVNFYKEGAQFKWHRDSEDPEHARNDTGPPIVSFTVGLSADFSYKRRFEETGYDTVRLNSGDVLLFGGPARMIVHSVTSVVPRTMPAMMRGRMLHGRLNVTIRDIGRGVIDTSMFPAYRVSYGGVQSDDSY